MCRVRVAIVITIGSNLADVSGAVTILSDFCGAAGKQSSRWFDFVHPIRITFSLGLGLVLRP